VRAEHRIAHAPKSRPLAARPRWIVCIDGLSVVAFVVAWAAVAARLPDVPESGTPWLVALALLLAYALADFASGLVHWLADRHFDPRTPILGPLLIAPFREHHATPDEITRHDLLEVLGNNALVTLPPALALIANPAPEGSLAWLFVHVTLLFLALAVVGTNLFHRWAHVATPPPAIRLLQRAGLILSPEHHARHHETSHNRAYCVTSGWLNPLLDGTGFFAALDRTLARAHANDAGRPGRAG
jgi:hypothetical protein